MDDDLALDAPWSIGEAAFAAICADAAVLDPARIVEFGSGRSSVRLAQAFPRATVLSIDDSAEFGGATKDRVTRHDMSGRVEVDVRPLRWQLHGGAAYQSYAAGELPSVVDLVLIDGPPSSTGRGREACLYQVMPALRVGGRVYLDDYHRRSEQQVVRNWLAAYPGVLRTRVLEVGHRVCVVEKTAPARRPRPAPSRLVDVTGSNTRRLLRSLVSRDRRSGQDG